MQEYNDKYNKIEHTTYNKQHDRIQNTTKYNKQ